MPNNLSSKPTPKPIFSKRLKDIAKCVPSSLCHQKPSAQQRPHHCGIEVSEFSIHDREIDPNRTEQSTHSHSEMEMYLHNIEIDYGKLSRPKEQSIKKSSQRLQSQSQEQTFRPSTLKLTNQRQKEMQQWSNLAIDENTLKQLRQIKKKVCFDNREDKTEVKEQRNNSKVSHKKTLSVVSKANPEKAINKKSCPQQIQRIQHSDEPKKWPRNVKSYAYLNRSLNKGQSNQKSTDCLNEDKNSTNKKSIQIDEQKPLKLLETPSKPSKANGHLRYQSSSKNLSDSSRRHTMSHSRIIKVANPSVGIQTKIYTYDSMTTFRKQIENVEK